MAARIRTKYAGVFYIKTTGPGGRADRTYYVHYRKNGKLVEEKVGTQRRNKMTPAVASGIRADRMEGKEPTNRERREAAKAEAAAHQDRWTIRRLWREYRSVQQDYKGWVYDENRFKKHLEPRFGDRVAAEINPRDVDRVRNELGKTHSPQTVRNVLELLRRVINFGVSQRGIEPLNFRIKMPAVNNERREDLSPAEFKRLVAVLENDPHRPAATMMMLALYTGLRRGELFKLQWGDLDFDRGFLEIRDPKGGRDARIPLNDSARRVLQDYRPKQLESPFVFPGRDGRQRRDIHKAASRIRDRAGLPKTFRPLHGLRHAYASMLASSGQVDMYTLQKLLTHKSPQMTQRYAHLRDDALKAAAGVADDLIRGHRNGVSAPVPKRLPRMPVSKRK